jgi:hypothetical protein
MRLPLLFGSIALVAAAGFATEASAQGIKVGKLKQMTAPLIGGNIELLAIGYDGDTTESEEKPSLFGFSGHIDISGSSEPVNYAWMETVKPNGDCLNCELRDETEQLALAAQYAALREF